MPDSNIIMIFGGKSKDSEDQKECYFYDYEINQFTNANPMICNSTEIVSKPTIFDNKMYCYFEKKNWQESDNLNLLIYDIKSGIWSAIT